MHTRFYSLPFIRKPVRDPMNNLSTVNAFKHAASYLGYVLRGQRGAILPVAIILSFVGLAVVVPTVVLIGTAALRQGDFEDKARESYLTDAAVTAVTAVIEDLIRGADANPLPPVDYIPPTVNFDSEVPNVLVRGLDDLDSPQLSVQFRTVTYDVKGDPVASTGFNPLGGEADLALDDELFYRLTGSGALPGPRDAAGAPGFQTLTYEVTSEDIGFTDVNVAEIRLKVNGWQESATVEVFVFNDDPNLNQSALFPWVLYTAKLLDHEHRENHSNHTHDDCAGSFDDCHDHHNDKKQEDDHSHHIGQDHHHHADAGVPDPAAPHDHHHHEFATGHLHGHHHGNQEDSGHHTDHDIGEHEVGDNAHHHHEGDHLHLHDPVHPHGHDHVSHNHDADDHHNGETVVSLFLSDNEIAYLNALPLAADIPIPQSGVLTPKSLKIRVVATVYPDPDHHHHVHNRGDNNPQGNNFVHDHHHSWHHTSPRDLVLDIDFVKFLITGTTTVELRGIREAPDIVTGQFVPDSLVSDTVRSTRTDDGSFFTISSDSNSLEFEVTSDDFRFDRLDSVSVPMVFRTSKSAVKVRMFVFNPLDPSHASDGYSGKPDLEVITSVSDIDRAVALEIPKADFAYLNGLDPISIKLKITASGTDFTFGLDSLQFIATTTDAQDNPIRQSTFQPIDPGTDNPAFANVESGKGFLLQFLNLHPGIFSANWALEAPLLSPRIYTGTDHDADDGISIRVFRGQVIDSQGNVLSPGGISEQPNNQDNDNTLIAQANAHHGTDFLTTGLFDVDTGLYSIVYFNNTDAADGFTAKTKPFTASGDPKDTWIYGSAYKDYVVQADATKVKLRAVIRQIPGPTVVSLDPWATVNIDFAQRFVVIQSWAEPTDVATFKLDTDDDGILDSVDVEPLIESEVFTDVPQGGNTSGSIAGSAGLIVNVRDLNDPDQGVLIWTTGQGDGRARLTICDTDPTVLLLDLGDVVKATCGSLIVEVFEADPNYANGVLLEGVVEVLLTPDHTARLPAGAKVKISLGTLGSFTVENLPGERIDHRRRISGDPGFGGGGSDGYCVPRATATDPRTDGHSYADARAADANTDSYADARANTNTDSYSDARAANTAPTATPTATPTPTPTPTLTPVPTAPASVPPTPTPAPTATPTATPTPHTNTCATYADPGADSHAHCDADPHTNTCATYADPGADSHANTCAVYAHSGADAHGYTGAAYANACAADSHSCAHGHVYACSPANFGGGEMGKWWIFGRYGLADPLGYGRGLGYPGKNPGRASWRLRAPAPATGHRLVQPGRKSIGAQRGAPPILGQG